MIRSQEQWRDARFISAAIPSLSMFKVCGRTFASVTYTDHALLRMFQRLVSEAKVLELLEFGVVIEEKPNAQPYPKLLVHKFVNGRPLHVAIGINETEQRCSVITIYEPDTDTFLEDLKTRRLPEL